MKVGIHLGKRKNGYFAFKRASGQRAAAPVGSLYELFQKMRNKKLKPAQKKAKAESV